jgi:integrase
MRHHCATWAVDGGYTRDQVALVLGHARPGATTRYVHSQAVAVKSEVLEYVESVWLAALNA